MGYSKGPHIKIVAKLDPVDKDTIQHRMKVMTMYPVLPKSTRLTNQVSASTKPVVVINTPIMEARIHAIIMTITIRSDIPSNTASL